MKDFPDLQIAASAIDDATRSVGIEEAAPTNDAHDQDHVLEAPDGFPKSFLWRVDGIYERRLGPDGDEILVRICSRIEVIARCRRPGGSDWGRVVNVTDPDGRVHRLVLGEAEFSRSPAALLKPLLASGLVLEGVDKADQSVAKLLKSWRPAKISTLADTLGWTDATCGSFILPSCDILGDANVVFKRQISGDARPTGSMEDWRREVGARCVGNPLMILAVSSALAGPLLGLLGVEGGGFHFRGASSRGKSTLLGVAASVWGGPSHVRSWRATDNGMEEFAAMANDTLLVLDELHQVDPTKVGEIVYMLANGRGKKRLDLDGRGLPTISWRIPVLSSGEISLEEHMASARRKVHAGQEVRLLDITADGRPMGAFDSIHGETDPRRFAELLQAAVRDCHGVTGSAFVKKLLASKGGLGGLNRFMNRFCDIAQKQVDAPLDGLLQRALKRFAIATTAGEAATKFGLTGWAEGDAHRACSELFQMWFRDRDETSGDDWREAVKEMRDYVGANPGHFPDLATGATHRLDGWRDGTWIYFLPEAWRRIHGEEDAVEAAQILCEAGLLKRRKGAGLQIRLGRNVPGRPWVYAVSASVLD